jgi:sugar phosphate isomerase/epimerase
MKFGICSEVFKDWNDIDRTIDYVKQIGYDGLEIAPFTLSKWVTDVPQQTREHIVRKAEDVGLDIIGAHWLLVGPEGLYINHADAAVRDKTVQYLIDLAQFTHDVGGDVMIFGSPKQRNVMEGLTYQQAFDYTVDAFKRVMPACDGYGVTLCMEPLSTQETDFCATTAQTVDLINAVDHPRFRLMLDTKAMTTEEEDRPELIKKYANLLAHYHANDANLEGPGFGDVDFGPIFKALKDVNFDGYVSVEVFKFDPGPEAIAEKSLAYMKQFV